MKDHFFDNKGFYFTIIILCFVLTILRMYIVKDERCISDGFFVMVTFLIDYFLFHFVIDGDNKLILYTFCIILNICLFYIFVFYFRLHYS